MSVNPIRLADVSPATNKGGACSKCGANTFAKSGVCRACHNGYGLPNPKTLPTEQIASYIAALKSELQRRRDEITAALGGES